MKIGVLALQGAFAEHEKVLEQLGAECIELRQARDLSEPYDALVLPGGESTVQGKLLKELGMFDTIKSQIQNGMPVLATCAGAILLAETIDGQIKGQPEQYFGTIPMCIRRNAYGRQLGSFHTEAQVAGIGTHEQLLEQCEIYREIYESQFKKEDLQKTNKGGAR